MIAKTVFKMSDRQLIWMLTGALTLNTGCLVLATFDIRNLNKANAQWKKNHDYMAKLNMGLNTIASNPKADPLENRAAIRLLVDNINAEMMLEGVDFESIVKDFKKDE